MLVRISKKHRDLATIQQIRRVKRGGSKMKINLDFPREPSPSGAMTADERHEFLSSMGHELRSPLTSIVAHAEALFEGVYGPVAEAQKTALTSIQDSVRHLLDLITDVIDLGRIEAAAPPLHPIACHVSETARHCLERVAALARSRSTRLVSAIHPHDLSVMADARRLRQMITELLAAAILTVPTGGGEAWHHR